MYPCNSSVASYKVLFVVTGSVKHKTYDALWSNSVHLGPKDMCGVLWPLITDCVVRESSSGGIPLDVSNQCLCLVGKRASSKEGTDELWSFTCCSIWTNFQQGVSNAWWFGTLINHINLLWIFLIIAVCMEKAASTEAMHLFLRMESKPPQELSFWVRWQPPQRRFLEMKCSL